jgi:gamma-glutamylcyclotransferase (GGCT)/AIG2-like uncharacterized protein YtfP
MSDFLFLYGTLLPGLAPPEIALAAVQLRFAAEGFVRGRLYDLGHYPGAVLDPAAEHRIRGALFTLPEDPAVLRALDAYEEFDPAAPELSQFVRVRTIATLAAGGALECWIYVYNRDVRAARMIESGVWCAATQS